MVLNGFTSVPARPVRHHVSAPCTPALGAERATGGAGDAARRPAPGGRIKATKVTKAHKADETVKPMLPSLPGYSIDDVARFNVVQAKRVF